MKLRDVLMKLPFSAYLGRDRTKKWVLFAHRERGPIPGHDDKYDTGVLGRRWAIIISRWEVSYELQIRRQEPDGWSSTKGSYYSVGLWAKLRIGYDHTYYDGDHHVVNFGPLYVTWGN